MGAREEIEHLRNCHLRALRRIEDLCERCEFFDEFGCLLPKTRGRGYITYHFIAGQTLGEVLSILDKHLGECVAEHFVQKIGVIIYATEDDEYALLEGCEPGDRIAIYVRKEE